MDIVVLSPGPSTPRDPKSGLNPTPFFRIEEEINSQLPPFASLSHASDLSGHPSQMSDSFITTHATADNNVPQPRPRQRSAVARQLERRNVPSSDAELPQRRVNGRRSNAWKGRSQIKDPRLPSSHLDLQTTPPSMKDSASFSDVSEIQTARLRGMPVIHEIWRPPRVSSILKSDLGDKLSSDLSVKALEGADNPEKRTSLDPRLDKLLPDASLAPLPMTTACTPLINTAQLQERQLAKISTSLAVSAKTLLVPLSPPGSPAILAPSTISKHEFLPEHAHQPPNSKAPAGLNRIKLRVGSEFTLSSDGESLNTFDDVPSTPSANFTHAKLGEDDSENGAHMANASGSETREGSVDSDELEKILDLSYPDVEAKTEVILENTPREVFIQVDSEAQMTPGQTLPDTNQMPNHYSISSRAHNAAEAFLTSKLTRNGPRISSSPQIKKSLEKDSSLMPISRPKPALVVGSCSVKSSSRSDSSSTKSINLTATMDTLSSSAEKIVAVKRASTISTLHVSHQQRLSWLREIVRLGPAIKSDDNPLPTLTTRPLRKRITGGSLRSKTDPDQENFKTLIAQIPQAQGGNFVVPLKKAARASADSFSQDPEKFDKALLDLEGLLSQALLIASQAAETEENGYRLPALIEDVATSLQTALASNGSLKNPRVYLSPSEYSFEKTDEDSTLSATSQNGDLEMGVSLHCSPVEPQAPISNSSTRHITIIEPQEVLHHLPDRRLSLTRQVSPYPRIVTAAIERYPSAKELEVGGLGQKKDDLFITKIDTDAQSDNTDADSMSAEAGTAEYSPQAPTQILDLSDIAKSTGQQQYTYAVPNVTLRRQSARNSLVIDQRMKKDLAALVHNKEGPAPAVWDSRTAQLHLETQKTPLILPRDSLIHIPSLERKIVREEKHKGRSTLDSRPVAHDYGVSNTSSVYINVHPTQPGQLTGEQLLKIPERRQSLANLPDNGSDRKRFSLRNRHHLSVREPGGFNLQRFHRRKPIARDWSIFRKRFVAAVACTSTAFVGIIIGIYAGMVPSIQYQIVDLNHYVILGNVFLYICMAVPTFIFWPMPLLHGRKPYTLAALALFMPLQFPQAIAVTSNRNPYVATYRVALLLARGVSGFALGFANINFKTTLLDLFGSSLQSTSPHQEIVVEDDVRRHGGGMGIWLGIWSWCYVGSVGLGFLIGAGIITELNPSWGFWIIVILTALLMMMNVLTPEVRRSPYRRSVTQINSGAEISRRVARGEVKMHLDATGPIWWWEEVHAGLRLSMRMLKQPGFAILAVYHGWIYGQVIMVIVLLGALISKYYHFKPIYVGLCVAAVPIGALIAIPFEKGSIFSRSRHGPTRSNSMTLTPRVTWSSHLLRRTVFMLVLPFAGLGFTLSFGGPPTHYLVPTIMAGLIGFLSALAIAECNGVIMETFDVSDLQPGMIGQKSKRKQDGKGSSSKATNYSCFPRVCAASSITQAIGFLVAAGTTGLGGTIERRLGAQTSTSVVAAILLVLTFMLLSVLWRWKQVQVIPDTAERRPSATIIGEMEWFPFIVGNPSSKWRRMNILELGTLSRWTEIRRRNRLTEPGDA